MDLVELLEAHQKMGSLTNCCTCGAGDWDNIQPSGASTVSHWRHLARVLEIEFRRRVEAGEVV